MTLSHEASNKASFWATMVALAIAVVALVMDILRDALGLTYTGLLETAIGSSSIWIPPLMLVVGYALGKRVETRKIVSERIAEIESENEKLASQLGAITDSVTEEFMGQVPFLKLMAMDAYDRGGIDDPHDFLFDQICDDDLLRVACDLFLQDSLVPEGTRWVLRPEVRASIDEKPELLDSARRARERGEEGDYAMFTVLDGTVARDEKMYKERMGFVF